MPSPTVDRVFERRVDARPANSTPSSSKPTAVELLRGHDPSIHMLGLPKSYPQLGRWLGLAILAGAIAAFLLVAVTSR